MPLGPWLSFDDCINDPQMKQTYPSEESRRKVCGALEERLGGKLDKLNALSEPLLQDLLGQVELELSGSKNTGCGCFSNDEGTFDYLSRMEVFDASKRFAKIWAIDDTVNANRWGVTKDAIKKFLNTLKGKPLLGPNPQDHGPERDDLADKFEKQHKIGTFVDVGMNGSAWGIAEITDPEAWKIIEEGKCKFVSPRVGYNRAVVEDNQVILPEFRFRHIACVSSPAYGQKARVLGTCDESSLGKCDFNASLQAAVDKRKNITERMDVLGIPATAQPELLNLLKSGLVGKLIQEGVADSEDDALKLLAWSINENGMVRSLTSFVQSLRQDITHLRGHIRRGERGRFSADNPISLNAGDNIVAPSSQMESIPAKEENPQQKLEKDLSFYQEKIRELEEQIKVMNVEKAEAGKLQKEIEDLRKWRETEDARAKQAVVEEVVSLHSKLGSPLDDAKTADLQNLTSPVLEAMKQALQLGASKIESVSVQPEASPRYSQQAATEIKSKRTIGEMRRATQYLNSRRDA